MYEEMYTNNIFCLVFGKVIFCLPVIESISNIWRRSTKVINLKLSQHYQLLTFKKIYITEVQFIYNVLLLYYSDSVQFSSDAQSCPTLCNPMNRSTPGLPVSHQLPEFTQTHVHQVSDAIQSSHPLSSPSPPAPNPSQHQSLFQ